MSIPVLPEGLVVLDRSSNLPLSQQIYRAVRDAVRDRRLAPGHRLPSSRALSLSLRVSRSTVNGAFDLLQAEKIIQVRPGAAPTVMAPEEPERRPSKDPGSDRQGSRTVAGDATKAEADESMRERGQIRQAGLSERGRLLSENLRGAAWPRHPGALSPGAPALDVFPHDLWGRALRRAARRRPGPELLYHEATGHPVLRQVLARYLAEERGVKAEPEQILITSGMQAALSAFAQALADPGDLALVEDPGYLGARTAFHGAGLEVRGLAVDEQGADVQALQRLARPPRLIYLTPSHHYPTGTRMPLHRRLALIEAVRVGGGLILEDDYDSEFLFEGRPVAALQGLAAEGEVIYLGTFSKGFLPGLRLSYCVVPTGLVDGLRAVLRNSGRLANVHAQIALADFIETGEYRAHLKRIRTVYQERGNLLVERLRQRLGNRISVEPPTGNVQISLLFRQEQDDLAIATRLQESGFQVSPLSPCYLEREPVSGLIIGFAAATEAEISAFVAQLQLCLD